ncbi:MAG TPA: hypothetical protein VL284_09535 [Thermoanaerobaculia bacterium]|nr:hypothetical protein [Thermoanaerobaculia bacterium]
MMHASLLILHIGTAVIGLLSGALSMVFKKGSSLHRIAGNIFFVSMMTMAGAGAILGAFFKVNVGNVMGGVLVLYLVGTAWITARRREKRIGLADISAFLVILAVASADAAWGIQAKLSPTGLEAGYPAPLYFIFGTIAFLFAASDLRMIVRGGVAGAQRIARHLWRMNLAFLMALVSFYPSRAHLFSKAINDSHVLYIPHVLLIGATIFWMVRMLGRRKGERHGQHEQERARRRTFVSVAHDGAV